MTNKNQKVTNLRRLFHAALTLTVGVMTGLVWAGPPPGVLDETHANVRAVIAVQGEVTTDLMSLEGILGTAVGLDNKDQPALVVYVDRDSAKMADVVRGLPPQLRGIGVKVKLTDKFRAFKGKPGGGGGGGVSHTAKQTLPIQLGTSGGWSYDLANGYCCGGTLGSLIQVNNFQYILSNYHVFEADIVPGGNQTIQTIRRRTFLVADPRVAMTGDPIIQPGLIDAGCNVANAQSVATLVKLSALPNHNVDCSVAQVVSGKVRSDGAILQVGTISATTVAATLNKAVKKSGRTTGLTRSTISGLNATIWVTYDNECAGGAAFTKTFTGQIVIANSGSTFLNSGDSGALMVEDISTNPKAIGLLYAGSSVDAIANPIGEVLTFLGSQLGGVATMVGQ